MVRIFDPTQLTHPKLREFAFMAAWISVLVETEQDLEDLNVDLTPEERALPDFSYALAVGVRHPEPREICGHDEPRGDRVGPRRAAGRLDE